MQYADKHSKLYEKLEHDGISGIAIQLLKNYLTGTSQRTRINNSHIDQEFLGDIFDITCEAEFVSYAGNTNNY